MFEAIPGVAGTKKKIATKIRVERVLTVCPVSCILTSRLVRHAYATPPKHDITQKQLPPPTKKTHTTHSFKTTRSLNAKSKNTNTHIHKLQGFSGVMTRSAGRVNGFQNVAGLVGSGQNIYNPHGPGRVGSGQEVSKFRGSGQVMTREIRVTRGSSHHDPRVVFI